MPKPVFVGANPSRGLIQHEYGHYLQYQEMGFFSYYLDIGIPSLYNSIEGSLKISNRVPHSYFRTETDANIRSKYFYGPDQPIQNNEDWPINTKHSKHTWEYRLLKHWEK